MLTLFLDTRFLLCNQNYNKITSESYYGQNTNGNDHSTTYVCNKVLKSNS